MLCWSVTTKCDLPQRTTSPAAQLSWSESRFVPQRGLHCVTCVRVVYACVAHRLTILVYSAPVAHALLVAPCNAVCVCVCVCVCVYVCVCEQKAGGFVEMGRVCGNLAVSRALGDYEYKDRPDLGPEDQKIGANADMKVLPRMDKDNFFVMACDGIWDVMSNEQIRVFVDFYHRVG